MNIAIRFHDIEYGAGIFATPKYTRTEYVEAESLTDPKLIAYVLTKKDAYGNPFEISTDKIFGYDFTSGAGGVKIEEVLPIPDPIYKKL